MGCSTVCSRVNNTAEIRTGVFWRDVLSEFLATFMLVSIQCALPLTWGRDGDFSQAMMTGLGMGFIVATMAWSLGDFGGGHMNPAVTFAMVLTIKISVIKGESANLLFSLFIKKCPNLFCLFFSAGFIFV